MRKDSFKKEEINAIKSVDPSKPIGKQLEQIAKQIGRSNATVNYKYYAMRREGARKVYIPRQKAEVAEKLTTFNFKNVKSVDIDGTNIRITL